MAKIKLRCDNCGYEKEYEVSTATDEFGNVQSDFSGITEWVCPKCGYALNWDGTYL